MNKKDNNVYDGYWLAILESASNQKYVFETNRLRDHIGASYLIDECTEQARRNALAPNGKATEILCSSGHIEYLFETEDLAKAWIEKSTLWALEHASGLDICGVCVEFDQTLDHTRRQGFAKLPIVRGQRTGPLFRSRALPWSRPCDDSAGVAVDKTNPIPAHENLKCRISRQVWQKRAAFDSARSRIKQKLADRGFEDELIKNIDDAIVSSKDDESMNDRQTWRCILHADGNGMGLIFLNFGRILQKAGFDLSDTQEYIDVLQEFSDVLDRSTWQALRDSLNDFITVTQSYEENVPVYPLIVAGDDVTIITDGHWGLFLAERYLSYLEHYLAVDGLDPRVKRVIKAANNLFSRQNDKYLRACAGIAIFKHHFPIWRGYQLSESLCQSAKQSVREGGGSALDWHAVMDASPPDLEEIRSKLLLSPSGPYLTRRPYYVANVPVGQPAKTLWPLKNVVTQAECLDTTKAESLSSSSAHALRESLFMGTSIARETYATIRNRETLVEKAVNADHEDDVFVTGTVQEQTQLLKTSFLDAIDSRVFFKGLTDSGRR